MLNYEKLFEPYAGGTTLESKLAYWKKTAQQKNISSDVMELAINETFSDIAGGKMFSTVRCSCGCGIDKPATDLTHHVVKRMLELNHEVQSKVKKILQDRHNTVIISHMHRDNMDFINSQMPYRPWKETLLSKYYKFMNLKRSPILNGTKRVFKWITWQS